VPKRLLALLLVLPVAAEAGLYGLEYLTSDAATRLAFQQITEAVPVSPATIKSLL
jgi:hypothetical protein